ncbi:hypothetical protein Rumeso_04723 [Rubellimicrobium mesophilum DSM 19309]|uniref:Uncharacterized protein n=1 Tax=Rubellimicrobium mesophilum DSM 19309 TaxID=442562 RepID=A0A017HGK3_9RHOB|nr:hypothetical protein Rumeso_04723 [Rubellimicrobium mesophilum DSM 19309]
MTEILASGGEATGVKAAIGSGTRPAFADMAPVAANEPAAEAAPKPRASRKAAASTQE